MFWVTNFASLARTSWQSDTVSARITLIYGTIKLGLCLTQGIIGSLAIDTYYSNFHLYFSFGFNTTTLNGCIVYHHILSWFNSHYLILFLYNHDRKVSVPCTLSKHSQKFWDRTQYLGCTLFCEVARFVRSQHHKITQKAIWLVKNHQ